MPMALPEPRRPDHQAQQQLGPVLPAGERLVAEQERHEQREEARQQRAAPRCSAGRGRRWRHPRPRASPRRLARSSPAGVVDPRGQQDRQDRAADEDQRTRSAATSPGRPATRGTASGAESAAPAMPASEIREFALTSPRSGGTTRGTAAARVTPYALDATSTPSAAGNMHDRLADRPRRRAPSTGRRGTPSSSRSPSAGRG